MLEIDLLLKGWERIREEDIKPEILRYFGSKNYRFHENYSSSKVRGRTFEYLRIIEGTNSMGIGESKFYRRLRNNS